VLFEGWGFPAAGAVVIAVGLMELVAGALLAIGFLMPLPALLLLANMVGALATAGVQDGGANIVLPALLIIVLVFVLTRWGGAYQRGTGWCAFVACAADHGAGAGGLRACACRGP
jgi:uncharacterized membrane protein YphA (DoxX/SURF4 family)